MRDDPRPGRPDLVRDVAPARSIQPEAARGPWQAIVSSSAFRKALILLALAGAWQAYASALGNSLLFPSFTDTAGALYAGVFTEDHVLLLRAASSLRVLLQGYVIGVLLAVALTALAAVSRVGNDLLETLTAMLNPLPAIALLPLALIWFGLGSASIVFVLVHSVLWPVALNTHAGFLSVSQTLRMVGRNYGLHGAGYVVRILIPAALPSILAGLKIGWAFAWRTLIASELVFGVASRSGGLGWYIYENKNELEIANVFAGLLSVILIGLAVENLIFRVVESHTVRRWGMLR